MDKTRSYLLKGETPLFFDLTVPGAQAHDSVPDDASARLLDFATRAGGHVAPRGARDGLAELVTLARDKEQSFYRILYVERDGRIRSCLGFGAVSGCEATYDCFGVVATDETSMGEAFDGLVQWLGEAGARLLRLELDRSSQTARDLLLKRGFLQEGEIPDFYAEGEDQLILVWRPAGL